VRRAGRHRGPGRKLVDKLLKLRIFSDEAGKMNRSVQDVAAACCWSASSRWRPTPRGGNRPSFTGAAPAELGRALYEAVLRLARERHPVVQAGVFGADMQVHLVNDGPVTIPMRMLLALNWPPRSPWRASRAAEPAFAANRCKAAPSACRRPSVSRRTGRRP
jgi:D-tyrosyl-tRNA(Tyr) deacylase